MRSIVSMYGDGARLGRLRLAAMLSSTTSFRSEKPSADAYSLHKVRGRRLIALADLIEQLVDDGVLLERSDHR